ncbi:MAG TPA: M24 family metallopeptidase [Dehalococcoidales bacterium]|nr:M24 family metallopeptidase [Dehalococcoidales bacterium]
MYSFITTLRRGRNVWDQVNMPAGEFKERVDKIQKKMKRENIDALLVCGEAWLDYAPSCYITNLYAGMGTSVALIPREGDAAVLTWGSMRGIQYTQSTTWIKNFGASPDMNTSCVKYLEQAGLFPSTVGFAGLRQLMPYQQLQSLIKALDGCKIVDADRIISEERLVKSPRERDEVHRAARILSNVFEAIVRTPPHDMNELTLDAALDREARLEGAEDVKQLYAKPKGKNWTLGPVEDKAFSPGDTVIIYMAVEFERYWAETVRTFVVAPGVLKEVRSEVLDRTCQQVLDKMSPGKKVTQFYKEAAAEVKKNADCYVTEYGLGNGIGLSVDEPPNLTEGDKGTLQAGMCLALRLAIKDREKGAIMTGYTVHLAEDGPEVLS